MNKIALETEIYLYKYTSTNLNDNFEYILR